MRALLVLLVLFFSLTSLADDPTRIDIPETYNGIRCSTREGAGDFYLNFYRKQLGSMYWIANDRVRVLSTQLTAQDFVVTGSDPGGTYVFDYPRSDFRFLDASGHVVTHYARMSCVLCPADENRCPAPPPAE
jgi:hypothetical protein